MKTTILRALSVLTAALLIITACVSAISVNAENTRAASFDTSFSYMTGDVESPVESFENTEKIENITSAYDIIDGKYYFVAQRSSSTGSGSMIYSFDGKYITDFSMDMLLMEGVIYTDTINRYLSVEALTEGSNVCTDVELKKTESTKLNENGAYSFFSSTVSNAADLPEKTVKLKITLDPEGYNYINYTVRIDGLHIAFLNEEVTDNPEPDEPDEEETLKLTDEFEDLTVADTATDNLTAFNPHPEIGASVAGKIENKADGSTLTYYAGENRAFKNVSLTVDYADGYVAVDSSIKVEAMLNGDSDWQSVALTASASQLVATASSGIKFNAVTFTGSLPEGTDRLKISLTNDVAWTLFLDRLVADIENTENGGEATGNDTPAEDGRETDDAQPQPSSYTTDELTDFSKTSSHTDNFEIFNPNTETGLSVIGRKDNKSESSITYDALKNKYIVNATLNIQYHKDFLNLADDVKAYAFVGSSEKWVEVKLSAGNEQNIKGYETTAFKTKDLYAELPAYTAKVRFKLLNDVAWTVMMNRVELEYNEDAYFGIKYEKTVDDLSDLSKLSSYSENIECFVSHPETKLSVIGKTNGEDGYITYKVMDKAITSLSVELQVAKDYFNSEKHFNVEAYSCGKWITVPMTFSSGKQINKSATFELVTATAAKLPADTTEIRLNLKNDVAWVLFVDKVSYDTGKLSNLAFPGTGDTSNVLAAAIIMLFAGAVVLKGFVYLKGQSVE